MKKTVSKFTANLTGRARTSLTSYPVEIALGALVALVFCVCLNHPGGEEIFIRFFFPATVTWVAVFAISCLYGLGAINQKLRIGLTVIILEMGGAYVYWFDYEVLAYFWQWFLLMTALSCTVMVTPLMARFSSTPRELRFWRFNTRIILRFAVCAFYVSILYTGLAFGLVLRGLLLDWQPNPESYYQLAAVLFAGVGPWMFVAGVGDALRLDKPMPGYGLFLWISKFSPVAFLLILPVPMWAVAVGVQQSGWTELRYIWLLITLCFAILSIYGVVQLFRRQAMALSSLPAVIAVAFFLAAMGPWSATNVSRASQLDRFQEVSEELGILHADGTIDIMKNHSLSTTEARDLREISRYLRETHGPEVFANFAGDEVKGLDDLARSLVRQ